MNNNTNKLDLPGDARVKFNKTIKKWFLNLYNLIINFYME